MERTDQPVPARDGRSVTLIPPPAPADPRAARDAAAVRAARAVMAELLGAPDQRSCRVRYWDGSVEGPASGAAFTVALCHPGALRRMLLPPSELAIGEAFARGDFEVEGSLEAAVRLVEPVRARLQSPPAAARLARRLLALPPAGQADGLMGRLAPGALRKLGGAHSRARDAAAVRSHYDVGNEFYALFLDRELVYSCAYFPTGAEDLDAAQQAKLEHLCRKLRLRPGETLLDIGCGWGSLVRYAAQRFGVRATGITLSEPQAAVARRRIAEAGLSDRARIEVRDYRDLPGDARFDKVVSVGMLEHVGRAQLATYFREARRLTRPGGLFLAHGIVDLHPLAFAPPTERLARLAWRERAFTSRHVFPDGELVPPSELLGYAERAGWETRDVESLREHYTRTLRQWLRNLEARAAEAVRLVGEQTFRVWRLYLAGSANAFATGQIGIVQALLSHTGPDGACPLPPTRADLYRDPYT